MGRESIIIWFIQGSLFSLVRIFSSVSEEDEHLWCAQNHQISQFECSQPYIPQIWYDVIAWWYIWCAKEPNTKFAEKFAMSESITRINENLPSKNYGEESRRIRKKKKKSSAFFGKPLLESEDREEWIFPPLSSDTLKLLYNAGLDPCEKHDEKRSDTSISKIPWNYDTHTPTHSFFPFLSFADSTSKWDSRVHLHNTRACVFTISVACSCSCLCYRCWWCSWRWSCWWCRCWCWCCVVLLFRQRIGY